MARPHAVQLKRTRGWKMPRNTVNVSRPGPWGNPWKVFEQKAGTRRGWYVQRQNSSAIDGPFPEQYLAENMALARYRQFAELNRAKIRAELAGKHLACWCKLPAKGQHDRCHRSILLEVANAA